MSGKDFQNKSVLAAVKPLRTANSLLERRNPVLVDLPLAEDSSGLESLFQQHHDRVFRTAYRVTGSAADAEDVLQTVFLRIARGQEGADAADNTEAYLSRAAINASLDLLRSRKRSKAVAMDDVEDRASVAAFVKQQNPEAD